MQENRSRPERTCQVFIFPTEALASDEECYTYIYDTIQGIREGRGELRDLEGIRQLSEIMRLRHQRRRVAALIEVRWYVRLVRRMQMRLDNARLWLRREWIARETARRLAR